MRALVCSSVLAILLAGPARSATLTATRPGVMCTDPAALAKLTLPDGSSRSSGPYARPDDLATKQNGGCIDIPPDAQVTVMTVRKNTSIVTYDAHDGQGQHLFIIPNIDFAAVTNAPGAAPTRRVPGWADADYPPLVSAGKLFVAVRSRCPQQGWDEHSLSHTEQGPWDSVAAKLTPSQEAAIEREIQAQCEAGMSCPADIRYGMEVQMGYLHDLVRAICSERAPSE